MTQPQLQAIEELFSRLSGADWRSVAADVGLGFFWMVVISNAVKGMGALGSFWLPSTDSPPAGRIVARLADDDFAKAKQDRGLFACWVVAMLVWGAASTIGIWNGGDGPVILLTAGPLLAGLFVAEWVASVRSGKRPRP